MSNNFKSLLQFVEFMARWSPRAGWVLLGFILGMLCGCSTANNYKLPPYEVKHVEMTCDRKTTGLPQGLMCYCVAYGSSWDCRVVRY